METKKKNKIIGTVEMIAALAVLVLVVLFAGKIKKNIDSKPKAAAPETGTVNVENKTEPESKDGTDASTAPETTTEEPTTDFPDVGEYSVKNAIIVTSNSAMEIYSVSKSSLTAYAETINTFASKVPDKRVYCLLAPTASAFYGPDEYRTGGHSQTDGIGVAYSALSPNVIAIDAYGELSKHTNDYIYFRTDHHWTARGAYYAYKAFCEKNGFSYTALNSYESGKLDNFVGSMYRYTQAQVLVDNPDYVEYFQPVVAAEGQYFSTPDMTDGKTLRILSTNITDRASKYMCFIQGDKALERIVTGNKNGRKLIVIKESYGNAIVPFMLENYEEVFVLDPRQEGVSNMNLPQFVTDNGITDILFINYLFAPSNKIYMNSLKTIVNKDVAAPANTQPQEPATEAPQG